VISRDLRTEQARQALSEKRAQKAVSLSNPLTKGMHSASLRLSINAHCFQCCGGEYNGPISPLIVQTIRECESEVCPLNNVRPYQ